MENSRYKFRVWTGKYMDIDVWVNSNGAYGEPDKKHNTPHIEINKYDDDAIVMQFTGKLDDNRKEIYEGDIVVDIIGLRYLVEWNDDTCKYQLSDGSDLNDNDRYGTYLVVIGNIYENPNLIN